MLLKTFHAKDMSEALRQVKAELGPDAVILGSKQIRKKGILGFGSRVVYEITATAELKPAPRRQSYQEQQLERQTTTREELQNSLLAPLAREVRELREQVAALSRRDRERGNERFEVPAPVRQAPLRPQDEIECDELEELKKLLVMPESELEREAPVQAKRPPLATKRLAAPQAQHPIDALQLLKKGGVDEVAARKIMEELQTQDPGIGSINDRMREAIGRTIVCTGQGRLRKGMPRIVVLVGPTGVGKTTAAVKIAAHHALKKKNTVALVNMDQIRVGAGEQLKTYARIMDVPYAVASTAEELDQVIQDLSDRDLIIIDTPGMSPRDAARMNELQAALDMGQHAEVHLCLAATSRQEEMEETLKRFSNMGVSRLLFTKLDESGSFGSIVNVQCRTGIPLSYFGTGQRVPDDLETATGAKVAELVLGEKEEGIDNEIQQEQSQRVERIVPWKPARTATVANIGQKRHQSNIGSQRQGGGW